MKQLCTQMNVAQVLARLTCPAVQCGATTAMYYTFVNEKETMNYLVKKYLPAKCR